ncbi:PREDICTED: uncharacterized protein LOC106816881, partial [Priapulus caudatus]|uniref:Uncharacterized protein LOC106816881 n=1 Tax=Priapulus caudatus TaxID=37621 RepID=A0ABM1EXT8_PRICU
MKSLTFTCIQVFMSTANVGANEETHENLHVQFVWGEAPQRTPLSQILLPLSTTSPRLELSIATAERSILEPFYDDGSCDDCVLMKSLRFTCMQVFMSTTNVGANGETQENLHVQLVWGEAPQCTPLSQILLPLSTTSPRLELSIATAERSILEPFYDDGLCDDCVLMKSLTFTCIQ